MLPIMIDLFERRNIIGLRTGFSEFTVFVGFTDERRLHPHDKLGIHTVRPYMQASQVPHQHHLKAVDDTMSA